MPTGSTSRPRRTSPPRWIGCAITDRGGHVGVRFATFNASLNRLAPGRLRSDLATPDDSQARNVAETIQRVRPDVLLVGEFDFDEDGVAAALFRDNYLAVPQGGAEPIDFRYHFLAPVNTGIPSGHDLGHDGRIGGPDDAFGFGLFPGQYGMLVYSRYPIDVATARTFQTYRWADLPGNLMPTDFYSVDEQRILRLSSKSHWDVPISIGGRSIHLLASHPTPPVFDGPEGRNRRRNHDEVRFWVDYLAGESSTHLYDDAGARGGLASADPFVIVGDLNCDPYDGASLSDAIRALLTHPRVNQAAPPTSEGALEWSRRRGGEGRERRGDPARHTAEFGAPAGGLRVDYVLPSADLRVLDSGVFWPVPADPLSRLTGGFPFPTSDHRMVWADVRLR